MTHFVSRQFPVIVMALVAIRCAPLPSSAAEVSWIGETGDWGTAANWSTGAVPGEDDDVIINKPGIDIVVSHSSGSHSVKSITSQEEIVISGGELSVSASVQTTQKLTFATGGTLKGGTVSATAGGQLVAAGGTLDGVTLAADVSGDELAFSGDLTLSSGARIALTRSLTNTGVGTQAVSGNGEISLLGGYFFLGGGHSDTTTTIGPQIRITGTGEIRQIRSATLVNHGLITVEGENNKLDLNISFFTNHGTMSVAAGTSLSLSAIHWSNQGVINLVDGSLSFGGTITQADAGTINRNGGIINFTGQLTGGLALTAQTGSWNLVNASILGGTISASGGAQVQSSGGATLENVTLATHLTANDNIAIAGDLTLVGATLTLKGGARIGSNDNQTIGGDGEILIPSGGGFSLRGGDDSWVILGPRVTLRGWGWLSEELPPARFINKGTIIHEGEELPLYIRVTEFINEGVIRARDGATPEIGAKTWRNEGFIVTEPGTTLTLGGEWSNNGSIQVEGSRVNLGGTFTQSSLGTIEHTESVFNITGTINGGLVLSPETGSWTLGRNGTIAGGTIESRGGVELFVNGGTLDGVTLASDVECRSVVFANGLKFLNGAKLTLTGAAGFDLGAHVWDGDGELILEGASIGFGNGFVGDYQLTIGPHLTVRGSGGIHRQWFENTERILNYGTLIAEGREQALIVDITEFINYGKIEARDGAQLAIRGATTSSYGWMNIASGSSLEFNGSVEVEDPRAISTQQKSTLSVTGNLVGTTRNQTQHALNGSVKFMGSGTESAPQILEVMSQDLDDQLSGFSNNFAFGSLIVANGTHLQLIDQSDNAAGSEPEALYVDSLIVEAGSTLDFNGLNVYSRVTLIDGTLIGTTLTRIPDSGPLEFDRPTPGTISAAGELDEWTFFGRAGQSVTVVADIGGPAVVSPAMTMAELSLLDPQSSVLGQRVEAGNNASMMLADVELPAEGIYRVRVRAPATQSARTGSYRVAVWNVVIDEVPLVLNQRHSGHIENPYSVDNWKFRAAANQQVRLDLLSTSTPGAVFTLRGPSDWIGFENLAGESGLVSLPTDGNYTLSARGAKGAYDIVYAYRLLESTQTVLALGTLHTAPLQGPGEARLFRLDVTESAPLRVLLDNAGVGNRLELYVSRGVPPTRENWEYRSASGFLSSRDLLIPSASAGPWYVLVYADQVGSAGSFTIQGSQTGLAVSAVKPNQHASNVAATLTLSGAGFTPGTTAELVSASGVVYPLAGLSVDSFTQLTATLPANSAPGGSYSVRARQPSGATAVLNDAFRVSEPGRAKLQTRLIMPSSMGLNTVATVYVEYANTGQASMAAPLLIVRGSDPKIGNRPVLTLDQSRITQSFWSGARSLPPGTAQEVLILVYCRVNNYTVRLPCVFSYWCSPD